MANMDFLWASYLNHLTTFMYRTCGCQFVLCHSPCNIQSAYSARQLWHTSSKARLLCYNWLQLFLWNGSSFPYCMLHIQFHSKTKTRKYTFHVIKGKDILQSKVIEWPLLIHFLVIKTDQCWETSLCEGSDEMFGKYKQFSRESMNICTI